MAKRPKVTPHTLESCDTLFDGMTEHMRTKFGAGNVYGDAEAELRIVGLPMPSLACRYLLQSTVWPLSRFTQLVGIESSGKSSLMYEIMRWHRVYGGRNVLLETEQKDSPDLRKAILKYDERAVVVCRCETIELWQQGILDFIGMCDKIFEGTKSQPGPGRVIPMCCGIDSLTGATCSSLNAETTKTGFAEIGYARDANIISKYMKVLPGKVAKIPITIIGTNHLKPGTDQQGRPTRNIPGGKSLKFMETYEIEFTQIGQWRRGFEQGYTVKLLTRKNSLGPKLKDIAVDVAWWYELDEATGLAKQHIIWDWAKSSIDLLLEYKPSEAVAEAIDEIIDLHPVSGGNKGKLIWSKALDISKDNPIPYREAGTMLEDRPDLLMRLYPLMGIKVRRAFEKGVDYRKQWEDSPEVAAEKLQRHEPNILVYRSDPSIVSNADEDTDDDVRTGDESLLEVG